MEQEKHAGGRPLKFKNASELKIACDEYIANNPGKMTITGLAMWLGFDSRQSLYDYEKRKKFSYIIKSAKLAVENDYELALRTISCTGAIFALKNMGWKDKTEHGLPIKTATTLLYRSFNSLTMDVAIPLKKQGEYNELRYALRGLQRFYPDANVYLIGTKPDWFIGNHIEADDNPDPMFKERNIYNKITKAFEYLPSFLFINDDHHILNQVNYLHHRGSLAAHISIRNPNGSYTYTLKNTVDIGAINDYDVHCPIWYERSQFEKLAALDWNKSWGYGIKSIYCHLNNLEGTYYEDKKFYHEIGDIEGRLWFSTANGCNLRKLILMYPEKSKWEK